MFRILSELASKRPRLLIAVALGVIAGVLSPANLSVPSRVLCGWNVGAWLYVIMIFVVMARADAEGVRAKAKQLDESQFIGLLLAAGSALMSLVAIVFELAIVRQHGGPQVSHVVLTVITIVGSWVFVPTVFGMHYAHLYYRNPATPVLVFPDKHLEPNYWDFLYFSFTIAVASQTADVAIASRLVRQTVLAQAVLAFFFNASILALTINISAALLTPA